MKTELDPKRLIPLHPLEFRVLLVLSDGPAHGYRIVKEIEAAEDVPTKIYPANLYRRLRDLVGRRLIEECDRPDGEVEEPGRPRTYFQPTALGRAVARAEAARLQALLSDARARHLLEAES